MSQDDLILVRYFQSGKNPPIAFEKIVRRYSRPLFSHLSKYVQQREDIEDILQTVWIKAWRGLKNFKGDSQLSTWLFTIATREAYTFYRVRKIQTVDIATNEYATQATKSINTMNSEEILEQLQRAIDTLPDKQKEVFVMRYFEEMTYEEMSQKTGTSEGALKASYHHAAKKIEAFIKSH